MANNSQPNTRRRGMLTVGHLQQLRWGEWDIDALRTIHRRFSGAGITLDDLEGAQFDPSRDITFCQANFKLMGGDPGDLLIRPGNVTFADCDGVVCVPRDLANDLLIRTEGIRANEKVIVGWGAQGESVHQITKKGGCF